MLINMKVLPISETQRLINILSASSFDFHLTGSRYFGNATIASDWDFYAQDSIAIREFLEQNGFRREAKYSSEYVDLNVARVYVSKLASIDVQLQNNVNLKTAAQLILKNLVAVHTWNTKSKEDRRLLWNNTYNALADLIESKVILKHCNE